MSSTTMKAATLHRYGDPDVLELEDIARPEPAAGEVLVRVEAAGINPVDVKTRRGQGIAGRLKGFPVILGWDVAGVVEALGAGVTEFAVGDRVYGMIRFPEEGKAYAEYATAPAAHLARAPQSLTPVEAAAVPLAALTAWQALEALDLQAGETILIHAAAGGVGHFAVQLAHQKGAHVIGTASAAKEAFVRGLGAERVIDYTQGPFEEKAQDVDAVLVTVAGEVRERSPAVLRPGGRLISIVGLPTNAEAAKAEGRTAGAIMVHPDAGQLQEIASRIDRGDLKPTVSAVFPLAEAAAAHRQSETGKTRGKIVLEIAPAQGMT
jgi:NADPH2:quinone reductase